MFEGTKSGKIGRKKTNSAIRNGNKGSRWGDERWIYQQSTEDGEKGETLVIHHVIIRVKYGVGESKQKGHIAGRNIHWQGEGKIGNFCTMSAPFATSLPELRELATRR